MKRRRSILQMNIESNDSSDLQRKLKKNESRVISHHRSAPDRVKEFCLFFLTYEDALSLPDGGNGVRGFVDAVHLVTCSPTQHREHKFPIASPQLKCRPKYLTVRAPGDVPRVLNLARTAWVYLSLSWRA